MKLRLVKSEPFEAVVGSAGRQAPRADAWTRRAQLHRAPNSSKMKKATRLFLSSNAGKEIVGIEKVSRRLSRIHRQGRQVALRRQQADKPMNNTGDAGAIKAEQRLPNGAGVNEIFAPLGGKR